MPRRLLFLLILSSTAAATPEPDPCAGRRIHIRRLPLHFNTDLLWHCDTTFPLADHPSATPSCASLANHGLGLRTHNVAPHRRTPLVDDPARADAMFLP
jgi:hypothetical protein